MPRRAFIKAALEGAAIGSLLYAGIETLANLKKISDREKNKTLTEDTKAFFEKCYEQYKANYLKTLNEKVVRPKISFRDKIKLKYRFDYLKDKYNIVFDKERNPADNALAQINTRDSNNPAVPDTVLVKREIHNVQDSIKAGSVISLTESNYHHVSESHYQYFSLWIAEISHRALQDAKPNHLELIGKEYGKYTEEELYTQDSKQEYIAHEVIEPAILSYMFQPTTETDMGLEDFIEKSIKIHEIVIKNIKKEPYTEEEDLFLKHTREIILHCLIDTPGNLKNVDLYYIANIVEAIGKWTQKDELYEPSFLILEKNYENPEFENINPDIVVLLDRETNILDFHLQHVYNYNHQDSQDINLNKTIQNKYNPGQVNNVQKITLSLARINEKINSPDQSTKQLFKFLINTKNIFFWSKKAEVVVEILENCIKDKSNNCTEEQKNNAMRFVSSLKNK